MLFFFVGMLVCALIAHAGELSQQYFEARRRQLIARIRGTRVPELGACATCATGSALGL